ncbi:hypothetical protein RRF57_009872 [Xylaria bambusicola]|uniref:DUF7932 domain-containing protein n=1 Tax=Xylaria bambusicola TaxID=326684 RepID=A0AAN7UVQ0_9PEZI
MEYERNGRPGMDALQSISGSAGGHLSVQIVESPAIKGGIRAIVVASQPSDMLPSPVDVPVGRDLLLTAMGGNGEDGMNGEDGTDGRDGVSGMDASETSEATPGSDGGHGGKSVALGTYDYGKQLITQAVLDVAATVEMAEMSSGMSPAEKEENPVNMAGQVAAAGEEKGAKDTNEAPSLTYLIWSYSNLTRALVDAQTGNRTNATQLIVQAATRLQEFRSPEVSPDLCKCHGGQGNCTGCDSRPLFQTHKRVKGLDGLSGQSGEPCTNNIHNGMDGLQGNVAIVVQKSDGSRQEYNSLYNLELADFEAEDENRDEIFEPGEHLFIRRITVRNSGGMPSPTRPIQLYVVESDWFKPIDGQDGRTFLPSIREGSSVTIDGPIQILIREREEYEMPETGALFARHEAIHLKAVMPWVEREIPNFEFNREIELKYPCELRNIQALPTVAQGSQRGAALTLKQQLRVHSDAPIYQHVAAIFKLYLGKPKQHRPGSQSDLNLVHVVEVMMQVSDHYVNHPGASFLLVTNSETRGERAQSIRRFINSSLGMQIDTWNISLYAGFGDWDQDSGTLINVLSRYHGRTIIFLGNQVSFFGLGRKNIFDICDPECIAIAAAKDTKLLFLDTPDFEAHKKLISDILFWPNQPVTCTRANISQSHKFHSVSEFATAFTQQKQYNNLSHSFLWAQTSWQRWSPNSFGKELPTEKFLVTFHASSPLDIIIVTGIPHHNSIAALEGGTTSEQMADTSASDGLPRFEAYMIVAAIALDHRVSLLWDTVAESVGNEIVLAFRSQFAIEALTTSLIQTTHREVELLLQKAPWPDRLLPSNPAKLSFEEVKTLLASHLPTLHAILFHPQASDPAVVVNDNVRLVLSYALAATRPQSKQQITARVLIPTHNRRRRANALLKVGITMLLRNKGITEISLLDFFSRADRVHTSSNSTKRNTSAAILRMVAGLTKQSEHAVVSGKQDATDIVRNSIYLAPRDWDKRVEKAKEQSNKVAEDASKAQEVLRRMRVS